VNAGILSIKELYVSFDLGSTDVKAVDGADLEMSEQETLALIGESGSGKSILGLSILGLLPSNAVIKGDIAFARRDLRQMSEDEMRKIRGGEIAWIPQDPATAFNPVLNVGFQLAEPLLQHASAAKSKICQQVRELLTFFDIQPAGQRAGEYPHQYSGGMRQRALMAMGTATRPKLLIADEPTKGIDNSRKAQVAAMFRRIKDENPALAVLLITHDLPFARSLSQRIAVMYCGQIVEISATGTFFDSPAHPYAKALLESLPSRGLKSIPGEMPSMVNPPPGCRFHSRCAHARELCGREQPALFSVNGTKVRCWRYA